MRCTLHDLVVTQHDCIEASDRQTYIHYSSRYVASTGCVVLRLFLATFLTTFLDAWPSILKGPFLVALALASANIFLSAGAQLWLVLPGHGG